jgi:hypothetical protein
MEQSAKTYTKEEKEDIFEVVNSIHLKLKGNAKKITKRKFVHTWKPDSKSMGCYDLFIKLYESEGVYDSMNDWFKDWVSDESPSQYVNHKPVPYAKHRRLMGYRDEEIANLEEQLEDIEQGKGYIKIDIHEDQVKELKREYKYLQDELEDTTIKLNNRYQLMEEKYKGNINRLEEQLQYYKKLSEYYGDESK